MGEAEILIAGLLVAVAGLSALARSLSVPYPIVLVLGGAVLGFVPGLPEVKLDPEVVLVVFLPPLLYGASIYANSDDLRANLRGLTLNAVALVLVTMWVVAWAAHALIPGIAWEAAFVLGAIVSAVRCMSVGLGLNADRRAPVVGLRSRSSTQAGSRPGRQGKMPATSVRRPISRCKRSADRCSSSPASGRGPAHHAQDPAASASSASAGSCTDQIRASSATRAGKCANPLTRGEERSR